MLIHLTAIEDWAIECVDALNNRALAVRVDDDYIAQGCGYASESESATDVANSSDLASAVSHRSVGRLATKADLIGTELHRKVDVGQMTSVEHARWTCGLEKATDAKAEDHVE